MSSTSNRSTSRSTSLAAGRIALVAAAAASLSCGPALLEPRAPAPPPDPARSRPVGRGFYLTAIPDGAAPPSNARGEPVRPKVVDGFARAPATNDWWSSLIWQFDAGGAAQPYSQPMYPHPLAVQAEPGGLGVSYPDRPVVSERRYRYPYQRDLLVGVDGLRAPAARVADYSDWTVTAAWDGGDRGMTATFGHGLPYVYVRTTGAHPAVVEVADGAGVEVRRQEREALALVVRGRHYGLFAPAGAAWRRDGRRFVSDLAGKGFFAVAALPDGSDEAFALVRAHAYAHVTDTRVDWEYRPGEARVVTRFRADAELVEPGPGRSAAPLLALYRHQWLRTDAPLTPHQYASPRGAMKVLAGGEFETTATLHGVVPVLPYLGGDADELRGLVDDAFADGELVPPGPEGTRDSYWTGKALGRLAVLAHLADQVGHGRARDQFVQAMKNELEDWFDGQPPRLFFYDATWRTLIGEPQAYFSGSQLNDHHFHYGYFVFAAATVARFDPAWAARDRWGGFVDLLIADAASWRRDDDRFPFLRSFDPYAGHSWANGPALFEHGNNQESSSEEIHFAAAVLLWGATTGDDAIRDLGAFLYTTAVAAAEQYWFDVDDAVFPDEFPHRAAGIVWGDGAAYETWWDPNPIYVHGINYLPFTGASLYLGARPDYARASWDEIVRGNRGEPLQWRDLMWMYLALSDAPAAAARLERDRYFTPERGNSRAWLLAWIQTLAAAGAPDFTVTADVPTYAVLGRGADRTYILYNPTPEEITARFSDGATVTAPARALVHRRGKGADR